MSRYNLTAPMLDDLERGVADEHVLAIAMPQLIAAAREYLDSNDFREAEERRAKIEARWQIEQAERRCAERLAAEQRRAESIAQFQPFLDGAAAPYAVRQ